MAPHRNGNDGVTIPNAAKAILSNPDGVQFFRKEQSYEFEKIHSFWLRSSMRFRSLNCDGADERARWFDVPGGNARPSHVTFDRADANASRSDDEFTLGLPTVWRPRLQSK
jgi:hypothetical protein